MGVVGNGVGLGGGVDDREQVGEVTGEESVEEDLETREKEGLVPKYCGNLRSLGRYEFTQFWA